MIIKIENSIPELHPQYITSRTGERLSVILPMPEWEVLLDLLEDIEDIADIAKTHDEPTISWELVKRELEFNDLPN